MRKFYYILKRIIYSFISKKVLLIIILILLSLLLINSNVFAASDPFTGMETYAWEQVIALPEYNSGNYFILATKFYSEYRVFFIQKQSGLKCYYSNNGSTRHSKYGINQELQHYYFNMPITFNQYKITSNGTITQTYSNQVENEYIVLNANDHRIYYNEYIYR